MNQRACIFLLSLLCLTACQSRSEEKLSAFSSVRAESMEETAPPIQAGAAQRKHDADHAQEWENILAAFGDVLKRFEMQAPGCAPDGRQPEPPVLPDASRLREETEAICERLAGEMARIDPTGTQSGLLPHARRLSRLMRTVLPAALEIACTHPEIFRNRMAAAHRDLARMKQYLREARTMRP